MIMQVQCSRRRYTNLFQENNLALLCHLIFRFHFGGISNIKYAFSGWIYFLCYNFQSGINQVVVFSPSIVNVDCLLPPTISCGSLDFVISLFFFFLIGVWLLWFCFKFIVYLYNKHRDILWIVLYCLVLRLWFHL